MFSMGREGGGGGGVGRNVGHEMGTPLMVVTGSRGVFSDAREYAEYDVPDIIVMSCNECGYEGKIK